MYLTLTETTTTTIQFDDLSFSLVWTHNAIAKQNTGSNGIPSRRCGIHDEIHFHYQPQPKFVFILLCVQMS